MIFKEHLKANSYLLSNLEVKKLNMSCHISNPFSRHRFIYCFLSAINPRSFYGILLEEKRCLSICV